MFSVAPMTVSPGCFSTGIDSPVSIDSSTDELPCSTTPSTGTFSPGRTRTASPTWTIATGTSRSTPVGWPFSSSSTTRAVLACRPISRLMAALVWPLARASSQRPSRIRAMMMTRALVIRLGRHAPRDGDAGQERHEHAEQVGNGGAGGDQRIHVRRAVAERLPGAPIEAPAGPELDWRGEQRRTDSRAGSARPGAARAWRPSSAGRSARLTIALTSLSRASRARSSASASCPAVLGSSLAGRYRADPVAGLFDCLPDGRRGRRRPEPGRVRSRDSP